MHPAPARGHRPRAATLAALGTAALAAAVIPAAAGLAFLISLAVRRPLIAVAARRWPWLAGRPAAQLSRRALTALTAAWAIGLLAAAAIQGAGAETVTTIMQGDPGVLSGVFVFEVHPISGFPGDSLPGGPPQAQPRP